MSNWIAVKDKLPESSNPPVLALCLDDVNDYAYPYVFEEAVQVAFYSSNKWWLENFYEKVKEDNIIEDVTHWMPIPKIEESNG